MQFNSIKFIIFFPIVVILYFSIPHRYRWIFLLSASYYFYMCWKPEYILLILTSTFIAYYTGIRMGALQEKEKRKKYLIFSLLTSLGLLFLFKYFNFFNESAKAVFERYNLFYNIPAFELLLPIGISFYTFQTLSYSIDIYRGERTSEKHLGIFALYVAFFPQLVAGPIGRSTKLIPQFYKKNRFEYNRITDGLRLMLWGFFKKIVIADRLALFVNEVYNHPTEFQGITLMAATVFFTFQIYCDFSGYSDIAIGGAQILGYNLMENFRRPYFATSISEFWRRWHISLSTWFRDYMYIPLGGNRVTQRRLFFNIFIVFLVSGLWHGANWTFVIWGALHGGFLITGILTRDIKRKITTFIRLDRLPTLLKVIRIISTFSLVCFAWIFFRANSISDALYIVTHLFDGSIGDWFAQLLRFEFTDELLSPFRMGKTVIGFGVALFFIGVMEYVHLVQKDQKFEKFLSEKPVWIRWATYNFLISGIFFFGKFSTSTEFIYFQF